MNKSLLGITEIQYIRGLIVADKLENNYEQEGMNVKIDRQTSMHEFTNNLLSKLDKLEEQL